MLTKLYTSTFFASVLAPCVEEVHNGVYREAGAVGVYIFLTLLTL